jgi:hypothetical protein
MPYQLIIREEAHLDANEAYTYYEEKSPGLGDRFLQELIQRYNEIGKQLKVGKRELSVSIIHEDIFNQ